MGSLWFYLYTLNTYLMLPCMLFNLKICVVLDPHTIFQWGCILLFLLVYFAIPDCMIAISILQVVVKY